MKLSYWIKFIIFLVGNFGALALGTYFMDNGPNDDWYLSLAKAPWTPPGWVFGAAWFTIMFCFSFFMTRVCNVLKISKKIVLLYSIQWVLIVSWNLFFFNNKQILNGLIILLILFVVLILLFKLSLKKNRITSLLIVPYILWMMVAISLNAYIYFNN